MEIVDEKKPDEAGARAPATDGGYSYAGSARWGDITDGHDQLNDSIEIPEEKLRSLEYLEDALHDTLPSRFAHKTRWVALAAEFPVAEVGQVSEEKKLNLSAAQSAST